MTSSEAIKAAVDPIMMERNRLKRKMFVMQHITHHAVEALRQEAGDHLGQRRIDLQDIATLLEEARNLP